MGRSEVLKLIHQQQAGKALGPMTKGRVRHQSIDGSDDLLIEVGLVALAEKVPVTNRHIIEADDIRQIADYIVGVLKSKPNPPKSFEPGGDRVGFDPSRDFDEG
jgi:hypothetical protein